MMLETQKKLIEKLIGKTEEGSLGWDKTANSGMFLASVGEFIVSVRKENDFFGKPSIEFKILKAIGEVVDNFSADKTSENEDWKLLEELFNSARRKASFADEVIDTIFKELESL
ncbi:hypothetical protein IT568_09660 [bacterium]|nr:hypothetical protein [bacterium]